MISRKKKQPEAIIGAPGWVVTYGDIMTLILCFFVLFFSFSTIDVVKFKDVIVEMQGALGVLSGGPMVLNLGDIPESMISENPTASIQRMMAIQKEIENNIKEENLEDSVKTSLDERGLVVSFTDTALFDIGKADIKPQIKPILDVISERLVVIDNNVRVEGHTDPTPIHTPQFPSNWELSTARANAIIHYFIEVNGVAPDRLSAAGYAFYHPVVPNTTLENRAKNRRVDVIILRSESDSEPNRRQDALDFIESPETDGIIEPPDFENSVSTVPEETGTGNTGP